jgi:hypothetical protein
LCSGEQNNACSWLNNKILNGNGIGKIGIADKTSSIKI